MFLKNLQQTFTSQHFLQITLHSKFTHVYDQTLLHKLSQAEQMKRMDLMLEEYRAELRKLQDQNEKLLEDMKDFTQLKHNPLSKNEPVKV